MNINEFAERVVFGTTLDEKLQSPQESMRFQHGQPSFSLDSVAAPGRPDGLKMQSGPGAAQPPSDSELENEQARGRLLHFLANHELLATELMALVLLKFPDAPHAFRQGVLVTLQEEQEHTRLYLRRMKECGVEFGSFPLSGHFWRAVAPMRSPMEFVSRLSLTFEQANLDYSLHFSKRFRQLGDDATADILQHIYEDEIGHVRHGLKWFRQWKDPGQTDWEAFKASFTFPLSPQRARGPNEAFNREGRQKAGLSEQFIDEVELFRQSRGRTPTVRWFDAAAESSLGRNHSKSEQSLLHQLTIDLECLEICLSKQDDIVLVHRVPSQHLQKQLLNAGFELPEFVSFADYESLSIRKLKNLEPWAWTPSSHAIAKPLLEVTRETPAPWKLTHVDLFRKSWSTARLGEWLAHDDCPEWFANSSCVGMKITDDTQIEHALATLAASGWSTAIFKQDLATSGRGQRRFSCDTPMTEQDHQWLSAASAGKCDNGPLGIIEPELNRVLDLSFQWKLQGGAETPTFLGWTRPIVTRGRRYAGSRLGRPFAGCDDQVSRFALDNNCARLHAIRSWVEAKLINEFREREFYGHFGVDVFIFQDTDGSLRVKPMVELNPRVTMGHVAVALQKRLAPGITAEFRILSRSEWNSLRPTIIGIPMIQSSGDRLKSGAILLSDADDGTKLFPLLLIGNEAIHRLRATDR